MSKQPDSSGAMEDLPNRKELEDVLHMFSANVELVEMAIRSKAHLVRHYYESLISEGFTKIQALRMARESDLNRSRK